MPASAVPGSRLAPRAPSGPVLFARYAFGPNRLGLCGPDDADALIEAAAAGTSGTAATAATAETDRLLRELARGFEGAYPYLELIAAANSIADPLDPRVVEAYWLGGPLADGVRAADLATSLEGRFRRRLSNREWPRLAQAAAPDGRPVHAFHVLDVFPKLGLLRGEASAGVLDTMDRCRIRWGTVTSVEGEWATVSGPAITQVAGQLRLAGTAATRVRVSAGGHGFGVGIAPGDEVSFHWEWLCDRLTPASREHLERSTRRELAVANRSI